MTNFLSALLDLFWYPFTRLDNALVMIPFAFLVVGGSFVLFRRLLSKS